MTFTYPKKETVLQESIEMVQAEVFCRVMRIQHENSLGTAFTIESHGKQFIVTAKHLFESNGFPSSSAISLLIGTSYQTFDVDIRYPAEQKADIAVMRLKKERLLTPVYDNINSSDGLIYGQDVYFVGFPYQYDSILGMFPGGNMPIPFVKKACLSAILKDGAGTILLDGHNNPGFSGGPVCYKTIGSAEKTMRILGVVSGYRFDSQPLFDNSGNQTSFFVRENTGIIIVSDIKHAVQIADNWI